ncbi:OB-fold domain-containing protein [Sphingomonas sp. BIUV-7]|uniref:OB-fold domain-containing protein n=1 Tax=Sphingomonas natans TaxID=3063330 RepID=A0ABT8Y9U0_9SPHN|nr:OB-fold domain-containing protein [Sphingomonas sp. BIUV-7]MDO6414464.1 OB-fold domain-containing protein [Sphingomonas sp. BIUV-7]
MSGSRLLPQLGPDNRFFWTGGADGQLRLLQCEACDTFIHPPRPICPTCLSEAVAPRVVAGTGVIDSYTINRQKWHPAMEVPFVFARIAIDGAPGVILSTNIVGSPVDAVEIGDRVRVVFEQQDDVFLPLFEKVG